MIYKKFGGRLQSNLPSSRNIISLSESLCINFSWDLWKERQHIHINIFWSSWQQAGQLGVAGFKLKDFGDGFQSDKAHAKWQCSPQLGNKPSQPEHWQMLFSFLPSWEPEDQPS